MALQGKTNFAKLFEKDFQYFSSLSSCLLRHIYYKLRRQQNSPSIVQSFWCVCQFFFQQCSVRSCELMYTIKGAITLRTCVEEHATFWCHVPKNGGSPRGSLYTSQRQEPIVTVVIACDFVDLLVGIMTTGVQQTTKTRD